MHSCQSIITALPFIITIINDHLPRRPMPIILLASVPIVGNRCQSNQIKWKKRLRRQNKLPAGNLLVAFSSRVGIACKPCIEALCDGRLALPLGVCRRSGDVDWGTVYNSSTVGICCTRYIQVPYTSADKNSTIAELLVHYLITDGFCFNYRVLSQLAGDCLQTRSHYLLGSSIFPDCVPESWASRMQVEDWRTRAACVTMPLFSLLQHCTS